MTQHKKQHWIWFFTILQIIFSKLIDAFIATGLNVRSGRFQETMEVNSTNDGPVTIMIDS